MNIFLIDDFYNILNDFNDKIKSLGYYCFLVEKSRIMLKVTNGIDEHIIDTSIKSLSSNNKILKTTNESVNIHGINIFTFNINSDNIYFCNKLIYYLDQILSKNRHMIF
jgi:hypothetical protein